MGMSGGGKAGKGMSSDMLNRGLKYGDAYMKMGQDLYDISRPVQADAASQYFDTVAGGPTGSIGAINPLITRAVESSKMAGSQAQSQTADEMARMGLTGTPFGQNIMGNMRQSAELQQSQIPTQMGYDNYTRMLSMFMPAALGGLPMGMQGAGTAAGFGTQLGSGAQQAMLQQYMTDMGMFKPGK